ncbi:MAG TPA: TOBE domain-containing protein [Burkholderiales bacterium]|nr:TOBE domain-containing protein [Burkholderiales bacterium]
MVWLYSGLVRRQDRHRPAPRPPEHLEPCAESEATLVAHIDLIEPLGADTLVYGNLDGEGGGSRIAARLHASVDAQAGKLPLRYDPAQAHYFDSQSGQRIE